MFLHNGKQARQLTSTLLTAVPSGATRILLEKQKCKNLQCICVWRWIWRNNRLLQFV